MADIIVPPTTYYKMTVSGKFYVYPVNGSGKQILTRQLLEANPATIGNIAVYLPPISVLDQNLDFELTIKNTGSGANSITVVPSSTDRIGAQLTYKMAVTNEIVIFVASATGSWSMQSTK